jgi:integrase
MGRGAAVTRMRLDFIKEYRDRHGHVRRYFRRRGYKPVALPGAPGSEEFMAAYQAALAGCEPVPIGASRTVVGTISAAIVAYYDDLSFRSLAAGTRQMRRAILERFRAEHGDKRIALLQAPHVLRILGSKKRFAARNWLKTLRGLMQFAVAHGMRPDDPTADLKLAQARSGGFHSWTEAEIAQFEDAHPIGSRPRLALALMLYTAQRRSDIVRMGRQHLRDGWLVIRQQKTGNLVEIPVHAELQAVLAATPGDHLTFLTTEAGAPFSAAGFGNRFRDWCNAAGLLRRCAAHGLRKASLTRFADLGCSEHQIAAIGGLKSLSQVQLYTKAANRRRLAGEAMAMLPINSAKKTESGTPTV